MCLSEINFFLFWQGCKSGEKCPYKGNPYGWPASGSSNSECQPKDVGCLTRWRQNIIQISKKLNYQQNFLVCLPKIERISIMFSKFNKFRLRFNLRRDSQPLPGWRRLLPHRRPGHPRLKKNENFGEKNKNFTTGGSQILIFWLKFKFFYFELGCLHRQLLKMRVNDQLRDVQRWI